MKEAEAAGFIVFGVESVEEETMEHPKHVHMLRMRVCDRRLDKAREKRHIKSGLISAQYKHLVLLRQFLENASFLIIL